jgi:hypothetical protein
VDHVLERFLFLAEFLRALGVVPDLGVFEGSVDFVQLAFFGRVVKDTPEAR